MRFLFSILMITVWLSYTGVPSLFASSCPLEIIALPSSEALAPRYDGWIHFLTADRNFLSVHLNDKFARMEFGSAELTGDKTVFKGGAAGHATKLALELESETTDVNDNIHRRYTLTVQGESTPIRTIVSRSLRALTRTPPNHYYVMVVLDAKKNLTSLEFGFFDGTQQVIANISAEDRQTAEFQFNYSAFKIKGKVAQAMARFVDEAAPPPDAYTRLGIEFRGVYIRSRNSSSWDPETYDEDAIVVPAGLTPADLVDTLNGLESASTIFRGVANQPGLEIFQRVLPAQKPE